MSPRPFGPGRRVGVGRLRVDAKRAIAKLRDYQLADRTAWVLEAVRAAVASEATDISLTGDANDVWLSWTSEPWPTSVLPALFDELVSPESHGGQKLRLLATAINSALGPGAVFVDVIACDGGGATRARYTPELLELPDDDDDESGFDAVAIEPIARPSEAPATGMLVHLRRRTGFATLGFFFAGEPPELALARRACADIAVPMRVGSAVVGRHLPGADLIRVEQPGGVGGFMALVAPDDAGAAATMGLVDIAEHGVLIASYPLELGGSRTPVPVRVLIDGPRMQTNASRSDVNHDVHPVSTAYTHEASVFATLCQRLVEELRAAAGSPRHESLRAAALALLASEVAGDRWMLEGEYMPPLADVAAQPLIYNAVGEMCPADHRWEHALVSRARRPADAELRPWLERVPWVREGDCAQRLWGRDIVGVDGKAARKRAKSARRALRAQSRFRRHKKRKPELGRVPPFWVRAPLGACVPGSCAAGPLGDGEAAGIAGEIVLSCRNRGSELTLLLDGREIDEIEIESPIPFRAIANTSDLTPGARYRHVERDINLTRVERVVMAAVVAAAEALVLACEGELADGFRIGATLPDRRQATKLFKSAASIACSSRLFVDDASPLARASMWTYADGTSTTITELRGHRTIGTVAAPGSYREILDRPLVVASLVEHWVLRSLISSTTAVVNYEISRLERPREPATSLLDERALELPGIAVLEIETEELQLQGALAWGVPASRIEVQHMGIKLEQRDYRANLVPCHIVIDSDACIPDGEWSDKSDVCGLFGLDYRSWERQMAQMVARTLCGDHVPSLHIAAEMLHLGSGAGRALFDAISLTGSASELLGEDVALRLAEAPLLNAAGLDAPISAATLAREFSGPIPFLTDPPPAADLGQWHPMLADDDLAASIGVLLSREMARADGEVDDRIDAAALARNLAVHRSKPALPLVLPHPGPHVAINHARVKGIIGAGRRDWLELHIRIEGRPFRTVDLERELPVVAVFDCGINFADSRFEEIDNEQLGWLSALVESSVDDLLLSIARSTPTALVDDEHVRELMVRWLSQLRAGGKTSRARYELRGIELFPTVAGKRASVSAATSGITRIARWTGEWLEPGDKETPGPLDLPTLAIPDGAKGEALLGLITSLATFGVDDITDSVTTMQLSRRMTRGLLPRPTVSGAAPEYKRTLAELGERQLGPGEIALTEEATSRVVLHNMGEAVMSVDLDVWPPVRAAIEAPALVGASSFFRLTRDQREELAGDVQRIASDLFVSVAKSLDESSALPSWLRRNLARGLLAGVVSPADLLDVALFETTKHQPITWRELVSQAARRGDIWYTTDHAAGEPLDPERVVVWLGEGEIPERFSCALSFINADEELELDRVARNNQRQARVATIALGPAERLGALAVRELEGDGLTAPRGYVAPLQPAAAGLSGIYAYRDLHYLGRHPDECKWPTVAIVDDARLNPDRTWSKPRKDAAWQALVRTIEATSREAISDAFAAPAGVLVTRGVNEAAGSGGPQVRGRVWLESQAPAPHSVHVTIGSHSTLFMALTERHQPLPLAGQLIISPPPDESPKPMLTRLLLSLYRRILKQALGRYQDLDRDVASAHIAYGLAVDVLTQRECRAVEFPCLVGDDIAAHLVAGAHRSADVIAIMLPGQEKPEDIAAGIIDDGTVLAETMIEIFSPRAIRVDYLADDLGFDLADAGDSELERPPAVVEREPVVDEVAGTHPLDALASAMHERLLRLGLVGSFLATITVDAGVSRPLLAYRDRVIMLAGDSTQLRRLLHALENKAANADAALDAVVAHAITILNRTLDEVTDAQELGALRRMLGGAA